MKLLAAVFHPINVDTALLVTATQKGLERDKAACFLLAGWGH